MTYRAAFFPELVADFAMFGATDIQIACERDRDNDERVAEWRFIVDDEVVAPALVLGPLGLKLVQEYIGEHGLDAFGWRNEMTGRRDAFGEAQAEVGAGL